MLFTKSLEVTKLHCVRHRQVDFCVTMNISNISTTTMNISTTTQNFKKRIRQSLNGIARKSPRVAAHKFRKLT